MREVKHTVPEKEKPVITKVEKAELIKKMKERIKTRETVTK